MLTKPRRIDPPRGYVKAESGVRKGSGRPMRSFLLPLDPYQR